MNPKESILNRLQEIDASIELQKNLVSTAVEHNKRVYTIFNVNFRKIDTYSVNLKRYITNPEEDYHQMPGPLKKLRVIEDGGDQAEKNAVEIRKNILLKSLDFFPDDRSLARTIITFMLSFNSKFNPIVGSSFMYDTLSDNLILNYDEYLKEILFDDSIRLENPIFGIFALFSDIELLDSYVDLFDQNRKDFEDIAINYLNNNKYIRKRIEYCNVSSLRKEALLFSLHEVLQTAYSKKSTYESIISETIKKLNDKLNKLDIKESELFYVEPNIIVQLNSFFLKLSNDERNEILKCLNVEDCINRLSTYDKANVNNFDERVHIINGFGYDAIGTAKNRRGQIRFKNNLSYKFRNQPCCAVDGCNIRKEFLIASHIYPWAFSNKEEKVDPDNGLLLCPNHDKLFDSLLISFDKEGNIMFSDKLSELDKKAFHLTEKLKINIDSKMEKYMSRHREAMKKGHW